MAEAAGGAAAPAEPPGDPGLRPSIGLGTLHHQIDDWCFYCHLWMFVEATGSCLLELAEDARVVCFLDLPISGDRNGAKMEKV